MKKIMSFFTSAVITLCIVTVFITAIKSYSAENKTVLSFGSAVNTNFEGINMEIEGDTIKFITKYPEIILGTETEIELSRTDDGYLFRPSGDGKYIVEIIYYPPTVIPEYATFWFPPVESFVYDIEIKDSIVNINSAHRLYEKNGVKTIESFLSDGKSFKTNSELGTIFGAYYLLVCIAHEMDPLFMYYIEEGEQSSEIAEESLIMSENENAEVIYIQDNNVRKERGNESPSDRFPSIGEASMPAKLFDIICIPDEGVFETESGSIRIVLIEGKRSKVYDLDYEDYEPKPSTLKKTICPENDINADGSFNIADVVCLQSFLLGKDDRAILNWMAADMYEDGVLNVFDLVCMKKALIVSAF